MGHNMRQFDTTSALIRTSTAHDWTKETIISALARLYHVSYFPHERELLEHERPLLRLLLADATALYRVSGLLRVMGGDELTEDDFSVLEHKSTFRAIRMATMRDDRSAGDVVIALSEIAKTVACDAVACDAMHLAGVVWRRRQTKTGK